MILKFVSYNEESLQLDVRQNQNSMTVHVAPWFDQTEQRSSKQNTDHEQTVWSSKIKNSLSSWTITAKETQEAVCSIETGKIASSTNWEETTYSPSLSKMSPPLVGSSIIINHARIVWCLTRIAQTLAKHPFFSQ